MATCVASVVSLGDSRSVQESKLDSDGLDSLSLDRLEETFRDAFRIVSAEVAASFKMAAVLEDSHPVALRGLSASQTTLLNRDADSFGLLLPFAASDDDGITKIDAEDAETPAKVAVYSKEHSVITPDEPGLVNQSECTDAAEDSKRVTVPSIRIADVDVKQTFSTSALEVSLVDLEATTAIANGTENAFGPDKVTLIAVEDEGTIGTENEAVTAVVQDGEVFEFANGVEQVLLVDLEEEGNSVIERGNEAAPMIVDLEDEETTEIANATEEVCVIIDVKDDETTEFISGTDDNKVIVDVEDEGTPEIANASGIITDKFDDLIEREETNVLVYASKVSMTTEKPAAECKVDLPDDYVKKALQNLDNEKPTTSHSFSFTGLNHVAFCVENLERSLEFYCGLLGLKKNMDRPELPYRGAWLFLGAEGIHIMEVPNPDPVEGRPSHGGFDRHACLNCRNVEGLRLTLEKKGIPYQPSMVPSIFTRDPDGNGLEFIEVDA